MTDRPRPVMLGGYAVKKCPVRVHNEFYPFVETIPWEPPPEIQVRLDEGRAFEERIVALLTEVVAGCVRIDPELRLGDAVAATTEAMDAGAPLIVGGRLPDDPIGGRKGRPDLLVRFGEGYLPGDIKNHVTFEPAGTRSIVMSELDDPGALTEVTGYTSGRRHRANDGLQLAHYTRLLQACGRHPGREHLLGGIIGTSTRQGSDDLVIAWHALDEPVSTPASHAAGARKQTLLERYDHEHSFRVDVAERAQLISGDADDPEPLVVPIGKAECAVCPYQDYCAPIMGEDDPSTAITMGRLDVPEWLALRARGISTTTALAELDVEDETWFADYYADVSHRPEGSVRTRLANAVARAGMIRDGVTRLKKHDRPVEVPTATLEVDIDIENDHHQRVYMWGARTRRGSDESTAEYHGEFTDWAPMTDESERALAQRFVDWLRDLRQETEAAGGTMLVFHWSHPEWSKLHRILGKGAVADLTGDQGVFCDLEAVFKSQFLALRGTSIKKVAPLYGFSWRAEDAGGAMSMSYLAMVHSSTDEAEVESAKEWLSSYNEDDNAAMAAIRDGMRDEP